MYLVILACRACGSCASPHVVRALSRVCPHVVAHCSRAVTLFARCRARCFACHSHAICASSPFLRIRAFMPRVRFSFSPVARVVPHVVMCWFARHSRWSHAPFRASSSCCVVRVRASFTRCCAVSRVVNSPRLESLVLIKLLT
jgi:hypothetical protein